MTPLRLAVTGSIGAGKTTLASRLSREYDLLLLSSDAVRAELSGNQARRGERVFAELHRRFEGAIRDGRGIVLDSTGMSPRFRAMLRAHRSEISHIHLLLSDPGVFQERERRRTDREAPLACAAFFRSLRVEFHDAPDVVIATDHLDSDEVYAAAERFLARRCRNESGE